jgi:hypothetical protein
MYNPNTGESVVAANEQEHLALAAQGYTHEPPTVEVEDDDMEDSNG